MRRKKIEKIPAAVATLSRRIEYLDRRLGEHHGDPKHREFDRREVGALRTAVESMNLAQLFQRPESDPIALLEELAEAADIYRQVHADSETDEQERAEVLGNLLEVKARALSTVALADAYLDPERAA
ncbi:MAG TPA: hypothetical protein ENK57_12130 [Polyangiaceae bacterium]|nr:hypothetical protein [Polyangiaceae bacterium]